MCFHICAKLGRWKHPDEMLEDLTFEQLADWIAYYRKSPWTPDRDDLRQEVMIRRLLGLFNGQTEDLPDPVFPHFQEDPTPGEIREAVRETESRLEPNGRGGYRWK